MQISSFENKKARLSVLVFVLPAASLVARLWLSQGAPGGRPLPDRDRSTRSRQEILYQNQRRKSLKTTRMEKFGARLAEGYLTPRFPFGLGPNTQRPFLVGPSCRRPSFALSTSRRRLTLSELMPSFSASSLRVIAASILTQAKIFSSSTDNPSWAVSWAASWAVCCDISRAVSWARFLGPVTSHSPPLRSLEW